MINVDELGPKIILLFGDGKLHLSETTLTGMILAVFIAVLGIWMGSGLEKVPRGKQVLAELLVGFIYKFSEDNVGVRYSKVFAPYLGSLFIWLVFANATGLIGLRPVTADLNITAGLALLSFLVIEISALVLLGPKERALRLGDPFMFMLPMNLVSEVVLPITLALRLFGNIFGGMIVVELWMHLMEFLSYLVCPIPFLRCVTVIPLNCFFDIFEPLIQAYIFTMLTSIHIGEGLEKQSPETAEKRRLKKQKRLAGRQAS